LACVVGSARALRRRRRCCRLGVQERDFRIGEAVTVTFVTADVVKYHVIEVWELGNVE
jgi:hypothetical protein